MYRKNIVKVTAVILAAMMTVSLAGCGAATATETDAEIASVIDSADEEQDTLERTLTSSSFGSGAEDADKVETVYVTSDANGAVNEVIVSDWLKNTDGSANIIDATTLNDIVNVKGKETYKDNGDGTISWNANGSDIYYQGYSDQQLPVEVSVSYTLDGKEVTPEEIAGASGHVTIRFDYTNNAVETVDIGGEETEIKVPFAMVSGAMLDTDKFTNVEVTNGKAISDANRLVVVGMALPGLKESLALDEDKLDELELSDSDISIPEYVEISADTTDFELGMTLTMASSDILNDLGLGQLTDTEAIDDMETDMSLLSDGTERLVSGAGELANGAISLKDGTSQLYDGAGQLYDGTVSLTEGVSTLYDGVSAYTDGASQVNDGAQQLATGASQLAAGANTAKEGSAQLRSAMESGDIVGNANALAAGAGQVSEGAGSLASGAASLNDGAAQVSAGASQLASELPSLQAGVDSLCDQSAAMASALGSVGADLSAAASASAGIDVNAIDAGSLIALSQALPSMVQAGIITSEQAASIGASLNAIGPSLQAMSAVSASLVHAGETLQPYAATDPAAAAAQMQALKDGAAAAVNGANALAEGASQVASGTAQVSEGAGTLASGASQVATGAGALAEGVGQVYGGVVSLDDGLGTLAGGAGELSTGATDLYNGTSTLVSNNASLLGGVDELKTGAGSLSSGAKDLSDGAKSLYDGAGELDGGAAKLAEGVNQLNDGIVKLDEEGIQKLSEAFDGSLDNFVQRVSAVDKAGREYTSFTGSTGDMTGSVKFIIKTDAVKSDDWH